MNLTHFSGEFEFGLVPFFFRFVSLHNTGKQSAKQTHYIHPVHQMQLIQAMAKQISIEVDFFRNQPNGIALFITVKA